jgi:hypothetical protein
LKLFVCLPSLALLLALPAAAGPMKTFNLQWSGASYGNGAIATGWMTVDNESDPESWILFFDFGIAELADRLELDRIRRFVGKRNLCTKRFHRHVLVDTRGPRS